MPDTALTDADNRRNAHVQTLLNLPAGESHGRLETAQGMLTYRTHAAFVPVLGEGLDGPSGAPEAAVLCTAYLQMDADVASRPVCFAFNGGPGSGSLWLQFGALGPVHVPTPDDASMPSGPWTAVNNPDSWLTHFDLVFIDPPGTGWSASGAEALRKKHLSVDGDVDALAEVMRRWLTQHRRWGSPVYLAGESYGTTRGAALAAKLSTMGVALQGLVLISCAMDLQTLVFAPGNDLPYLTFLPAFAQVAQYHGLLKGPLASSPEAAREAAEAFVDDTYAAALQAGHRLSDARRGAVARRIAELTGLPRSLVEERNLRISDQAFFMEAMRPQGRQVGRLDARATAPMAASRGRVMEFDPGLLAIDAPYTMATVDHYARVLNFCPEHRYEALSIDVNKAWDWQRRETRREGFVTTTPDLARALRRNPQLRVFVASGRYDLGTPFSATDWSLAHLDAPHEVLARVQHRYYEAGHMMYTRSADRRALLADLSAWLSEPRHVAHGADAAPAA